MEVAGFSLTHEGVEAVFTALDELEFGVALVDGANRFVHANNTCCRLLGRTLDELRSLPDYGSLIAADQRASIFERRAQRQAGRDVPRFLRTVVLTGDGSRLPVELVLTAVDGGAQRIVLARDLRSEAERDNLIHQYANLVERMPLGIVIWDSNGVDDPRDMRLVAANDAASAVVGTDLSTRAGDTMEAVFPGAVESGSVDRIFGLRGTGRAEHLGDLVYGDESLPDAVYRRRGVDLGSGALAVIFENVTRERAEEIRRHRLLERLVEVSDQERRRLAMSVHDDPVQQLAAAALLIGALRRHPDMPERKERLAEAEGALREAMGGLRRLVFELSPPELVESGLESAIRSAADYLFAGTDVRVELTSDLWREPQLSLQTAAFRIASEALANARKHSAAKRVSVTLTDSGQALEVVVRDDGQGFAEDGLVEPGHLGLVGMKERASALGGECVVTSDATGTTVTVLLPHRFAAAAPLPPPEPVASSESESLRAERDSLTVELADAQARAVAAEGRLRESMAVTKALLLPDLEAALAAACERIGRALMGAGLLELVRDGDLRTAAVWRPDHVRREVFATHRVVDGEGNPQSGTVLSRGQSLFLESSALWSPGDVPGGSPSSVILVPLRVPGEVIGVLTVARDVTDPPFADVDVDFAECLADRVAIAVSGRTG